MAPISLAHRSPDALQPLGGVPVRRLASRLAADVRSFAERSKVFRRSVRGVVGVRSAGHRVRGTALRRRASAASLPDRHRRALRRRRSVQIRYGVGVGPREPDAMGTIRQCRVRLFAPPPRERVGGRANRRFLATYLEPGVGGLEGSAARAALELGDRPILCSLPTSGRRPGR